MAKKRANTPQPYYYVLNVDGAEFEVTVRDGVASVLTYLPGSRDSEDVEPNAQQLEWMALSLSRAASALRGGVVPKDTPTQMEVELQADLNEALERLGEMDGVCQERDEMEERALKAERLLDAQGIPKAVVQARYRAEKAEAELEKINQTLRNLQR